MSPFGIKLLTWLRLAGVPHEVQVENDPRKGPKKKSPWIEYDDVRLGDTTMIIEHLRNTFEVDPDAHLTPAQAAQGLVLRRFFEAHFSGILEYDLFVDARGWAASKGHFNFLPAVLRTLVVPMIRADFKKEAWIHGIGRHTAEERAGIAVADIDAAATLLGDQTYFMGNRATHVDCTAFAFLAMVRGLPYASASQIHLQTRPNLLHFCDRMADAALDQKAA